MLDTSVFHHLAISITLLLLTIGDGLCATDDWTDGSTLGQEFVTVFPWNNENTSLSSNARLSMNFINPHPSQNATVRLNYYDYSYVFSIERKEARNYTVIVPPQSSTEFKFNSSAAIKTSGDNITSFYQAADPPIHITSNIPISVLQNNYLPNGVGDSFIVLPKNQAGRRYAFSLPATPGGNAIIFFLPTESQITSSINVVTEQAAEIEQLSLNFNPLETASESNVTITDDALTVYAASDENFIVVVALRKMRITESNSVDYGSTMIPPIPLVDACLPNPVNSTFNVHISNLKNGTGSDYFTVVPPLESCNPSTVHMYSSGKNSEWQIQTNQSQKLFTWDYTTYGSEFAIQSSTDLLQIMRFGGSGIKGGYADVVPSLSQYVTGRTSFLVRSSTDQVSIIGGPGFNDTARLDSQPLQLQTFAYTIGTAYYNTFQLSAGYHTIESSAKYLVYITGVYNNSAYGYTVTMKLSDESVATTTSISVRSTTKRSGKMHRISVGGVIILLAAAFLSKI